MTPEEVERIVKRTLGRPIDLADDYVEQLRKLTAAYDATIEAKDKTIVLLREQLAMCKEMIQQFQQFAKRVHDATGNRDGV